jgi:hypothetical protein
MTVKGEAMTIPATVPVTITPEAAEFVQEKGYRRELEQMIEHTLQVVPGLRSVRVVREIDWTGGDDYINLEALRDPVADPVVDAVETDWLHWRSMTFPVDVSILFAMTAYDKESNGR